MSNRVRWFLLSLAVLPSCASPADANGKSAPPAAADLSSAAPRPLQVTLPVKIGATRAEVRDAYQGEKELVVPARRAARPNLAALAPPKDDDDMESLRYPAVGVWFFFDATDRVKGIRIEAPFAGAIRGLSIGDPATAVTEKLGEPTAKFNFGDNLALSYGTMAAGDFVRFDASPEGRIVTIFM
jgi:hypothetical protein